LIKYIENTNTIDIKENQLKTQINDIKRTKKYTFNPQPTENTKNTCGIKEEFPKIHHLNKLVNHLLQLNIKHKQTTFK
jgi:hypothetical protein